MRDTQVLDGSSRLAGPGDTITGFAARVLDVLVDRNRRSTGTVRHDLVTALADGMVTLDDARIEATLREFRRACISPSAMTDVYVPAAAALLGASWMNDRIGFAEVTIATARLQALVRAIGTRWGGDAAHVPGRRSILMIVPGGDQHTLGAVVATDQLRRMGLSVCLRSGPGAKDLTALLQSRVFDAAMLSIGHDERFDDVRRLVGTLRALGPRGLPILAGGAMDSDGAQVAARTGVDFVTQDLAAALAWCGLAAPGDESPAAAGPARLCA